jgi:hypothetical protein
MCEPCGEASEADGNADQCAEFGFTVLLAPRRLSKFACLHILSLLLIDERHAHYAERAERRDTDTNKVGIRSISNEASAR